MTDFVVDIAKFVEQPNMTTIMKIEEYCQATDSPASVSTSNKFELIRIRDGFARDNLELDSVVAEKGINRVCDIMIDAYPKWRVTFFYLLAEVTDSHGNLRPS